MYSITRTLTRPTGNNAFSYDIRTDKTLFVPSVIRGSIFDVKIGSRIVFADIGENGLLQECIGLESFVRTDWKGVPMVIFDNHNHAFYFWYEARKNWLVHDGTTLIHIDEHSDLREPATYIFEREDLSSVYAYTNEVLEVGNYIRPAERDGLIGKTHLILTGHALAEYDTIPLGNELILNLDLDFFEPRLDDIPFELKKEAVLHFAKKARLITIATSPFFIDQTLAIQTLHKLFWE